MASIALSALLAACATIPPEEGGPSTAGCSAEGLQDLVRRAPSVELGAEAMRRSGARMMRWIRPGDVVTMDYREDRLNVHIDGSHRVERLVCG